MIIELIHTTEYEYSEPVFLEPHTVKLTPVQNVYTRLLNHEITIFPEPFSIYRGKCIEGDCYYTSFSETTDYLKVVHKSKIEFKEFNPFSFIIYPEHFSVLPFDKKNKYLTEVEYFLDKTKTPEEMKNEAEKLLKIGGSSTVDFLQFLNIYLSKNIEYVTRKEGNTKPGVQTIKDKKGSCRDIAQLFIEICRSLNIPSRFVSGYYIPVELNKEKVELHAWAEAFIPGAGWLGFDPTHGLVCHGRHLTLISSAFALETLPITGFYRGSAKSKIKYDITCREIQKLELTTLVVQQL